MEKKLITGASGYIGERLYVDLQKRFGSVNVVGTYNSSKPNIKGIWCRTDITDKQNFMSVVSSFRPNTIIHAAAIASSSQCNKDPDIAHSVNVEGTKNVVESANSGNANVIYISTEFAANPSDELGKSKKSAEDQIKKSENSWSIIRPVQMVGHSPNTTNNRFHNQLLRNITDGIEPLYDNTEAFQVAWIGNLSKLIIRILEDEKYGITIPLSTGGMRTKYRIACDIFGHENLRDLNIIPKQSHTTSKRKRTEFDTRVIEQLGISSEYDGAISKTAKEIRDYLRK